MSKFFIYKTGRWMIKEILTKLFQPHIKKNSEVLFVSTSENILVLKGSLPGKKDNILKITLTK